jgi:hypothetical protein
LVSFEAGKVEVSLDGRRMRPEPGQSVIAHGADRDLSLDEAPPGGRLLRTPEPGKAGCRALGANVRSLSGPRARIEHLLRGFCEEW